MSVPADNRAKLISLSNVYFGGPASVLGQAGGIVFPVQPEVIYNQGVNYTPYNLTHTNYTTYAYSGTPSPQIQLTAQFVNSTEEEHRYTQGVIHFLRSVTKMFYGIDDVEASPSAGTPPPVLRFSAYGGTQFNQVPVVVGSFAVPMQSDTDLVTVDGVSLPVIQTITMDLLVTVNPGKQKNDFGKHQFISAQSYSKGFI